MNILIVDDDKFTKELFVSYLQNAQYNNFESFTDSLEAINAYSTKEYDIIITDLQMPNVDGLSFLEKINDVIVKQKRKKPYIIVVTGSIVESLKQKCIEQGCDEFLIKPVRMKSFIKAIQNYHS